MKKKSNPKKFKFYTISDKLWDCDILSVMSEKIAVYNNWTEYGISDHFKSPEKKLKKLDDLLREDLLFYSENNAEIQSLVGLVEIIQYEAKDSKASILLSSENNKKATIGFSMNFIRFVHLYMAKFFSLAQSTQTSNLHERFKNEALEDHWNDDNLYISILYDAFNYFQFDCEKNIKKYEYLYEPYEYCDLVIAIRRFALLHELAHFYISLNRDQLDIDNPTEEEYSADQIAYSWLMKPFLDKKELLETDRYELGIYFQAPLYYFLANSLPFAIHDWEQNKLAVHDDWLKNQDSYMAHPLKREMNLIGFLKNAPMFDKMPLLFDIVTAYIKNDVLAYESRVFLKHRYGPYYELKLNNELPHFREIIRKIRESISDAYYAYNDLEEAIVEQQTLSLLWIYRNRIVRMVKVKNLNKFQEMELYRQAEFYRDRRSGYLRDKHINKSLLSNHWLIFGKKATRSYEIHLKVNQKLKQYYEKNKPSN